MVGGLSRQTEALIGIAFLIGMTVLLLIAIFEFEGPTTFILLVVAGVFLLVALFFLTGTPGMGSRGGSDESGSQQQSVVIGAGSAEPVKVTQGGVLIVCRNCHSRVPETVAFCPQCGAQM